MAFKMKGSPMYRNFGIGSPLHDHERDADGNIIEHSDAGDGSSITEDSGDSRADLRNKHVFGDDWKNKIAEGWKVSKDVDGRWKIYNPSGEEHSPPSGDKPLPEPEVRSSLPPEGDTEIIDPNQAIKDEISQYSERLKEEMAKLQAGDKSANLEFISMARTRIQELSKQWKSDDSSSTEDTE